MPVSDNPEFVRKLASAGVQEFDLARVVDAIVHRYDVNRKAAGTRVGAFGSIGKMIHNHLIAPRPEYEIDWSAIRVGKLTSAGEIADAIGASRGGVNDAISRLIEHGFIERRRDGRSFFFRPLLPEPIISEWASWEIRQDGSRGTLAEEDLKTARRILANVSTA